MKMLHCPICGKNKPANRRQATCSRQCGAVWVKQQHGADFFQKLGKKAGAVSGVKSRKDSARRWAQMYPNVPAAVARAIYLRGYNSGHRAGVAAGYEMALKDMQRQGAA